MEWKEKCFWGGLLLVASSAIITLAACSSFNLHKDNVIRNLSKTDTFEQDNKTYSMVEFSKDNPVQSGDYIIGGSINAGAVGLITSYNADKYCYNTTTNLPTESNGTSYLIFTITLLEDKTYTIYDNTNKWYVCANTSSGKIYTDKNGTNAYRFWTFNYNKAYFVNTKATDSQGQNLSYNSQSNRIAGYKSKSNQSGLVLFKAENDVSTAKVEFMLDRATYSNKKIKTGDELILPTEPTKESDTYCKYEFDGWYDEKGTKYVGGETITENLVLTAKFNVIKKGYNEIFKSTEHTSIATLDYKYKEIIGNVGIKEEKLPNGSNSSTGSFTLNKITAKSGRENQTSFGNTKSDASIKFENGLDNTNLSISFPYDASVADYSTIKAVINGKNGSVEHVVDEGQSGTFTYNSLEDEKTIGLITSFELVWNEIKSSCNVYVGEITVTSDSVGIKRSCSYFDNLAIVYGFKYTFTELTEVSSFGAICADDTALIPVDGAELLDSSLLKVETPYDEKYSEVGYSIGLHISKETIKEEYSKKFYFATYFVVENKYYFSNTFETSFESSLDASIRKFELNESIKTDFEDYFEIVK